jgi:hypothetical protein
VEVHKIVDIKNKTKGIGKLESNRRIKALELEAAADAKQRGEEFHVETFREELRQENRRKGAQKRKEKRQEANKDNDVDSSYMSDSIKIEAEALMRLNAEREALIEECEAERANVSQALYDAKSGTSSKRKLLQAEKRELSKAKKNVHINDTDEECSVKSESAAESDGESEMHHGRIDASQARHR